MTAEKYFDKGNEFYKNGDFKSAIENYDKAIEINPKDAEAYFNRGNAKDDLGDKQAAIDDYDKAIEINPNLAEAYYNRGNAKDDLGNKQAAIDDYSKAIEINPNDADAYCNRGDAEFALGDKQAAIDDFSKAIEINPNDANAYFYRGLAKSILGDKQAAIDDYNKAIEINQNNATAYNNRGIAKYHLGDKQAAIDDYNKAIEINPNYATAYNNRGNVKAALGDCQAAIDDYTKAIEINPDNASAHNNRGYAKYKLGKYDDAIEDCNKAIKLDKKNANSYLSRAECYYKLEKFNKVKKDFKQSGKDILEILNLLDKENRSSVIQKGLLNDLLNSDTHYINAVKEKDCKKYKNAYIQSIYIISMLHISNTDELPVSYYTKKEVADALLIKDKEEKIGKFRLNSINYSNDPSEGQISYGYLFNKKQEKDDTNPARAFAGCFTFNADCLNHFRLYGKTDSRECTGVSITFNENFFERSAKLATALSMSEGAKPKDETPENKHALFRCIYIDPETPTPRVISVGHKEDFLFYRESKDDKIEKYKEDIKKLTYDVSVELQKLKKQCKGLDENILSQLFINLRYLTKHVAFKEEQECRIVKIKSVKDTDVKVSDDRSQMYLEYLECKNYVKEIVFGANASGINIFRDRLLHEGYCFPCRKSDNPFA
jgi:tetratricopeptide (TPR) repeat protein